MGRGYAGFRFRWVVGDSDGSRDSRVCGRRVRGVLECVSTSGVRKGAREDRSGDAEDASVRARAAILPRCHTSRLSPCLVVKVLATSFVGQSASFGTRNAHFFSACALARGHTCWGPAPKRAGRVARLVSAAVATLRPCNTIGGVGGRTLDGIGACGACCTLLTPQASLTHSSPPRPYGHSHPRSSLTPKKRRGTLLTRPVPASPAPPHPPPLLEPALTPSSADGQKHMGHAIDERSFFGKVR